MFSLFKIGKQPSGSLDLISCRYIASHCLIAFASAMNFFIENRGFSAEVSYTLLSRRVSLSRCRGGDDIH